MGFVLDSGATIMCPHGGTASVVPANATFTVGGNPALVQTDLFTISGCPFNISGAPSPCVTIQWVTAAMVTKISGVPVLLSDSVGLCIGAGPQGPASVMGFQTTVQGM